MVSTNYPPPRPSAHTTEGNHSLPVRLFLALTCSWGWFQPARLQIRLFKVSVWLQEHWLYSLLVWRGEEGRSHGLAVSLGDILSSWSDKVNFKHYTANIQISVPPNLILWDVILLWGKMLSGQSCCCCWWQSFCSVLWDRPLDNFRIWLFMFLAMVEKS